MESVTLRNHRRNPSKFQRSLFELIARFVYYFNLLMFLFNICFPILCNNIVFIQALTLKEKPVCLGLSKLDLSKNAMYEF